MCLQIRGKFGRFFCGEFSFSVVGEEGVLGIGGLCGDLEVGLDMFLCEIQLSSMGIVGKILFGVWELFLDV